MAAVSLELPDRPWRRRFAVQDKLRILAGTDKATVKLGKFRMLHASILTAVAKAGGLDIDLIGWGDMRRTHRYQRNTETETFTVRDRTGEPVLRGSLAPSVPTAQDARMKMIRLLPLTLIATISSAHAESYFGIPSSPNSPATTGTEWTSVDGSVSSYIAKGYRLQSVLFVGNTTFYFIQGNDALIRCSQRSQVSGITVFGCAKAIPPIEIPFKN